MLIGYARVSTKEQETYLQLDALNKAGVEIIYEEKASSISARPELQRCLAQLKEGDVLIVYKMDRVARSLLDLLSILDRIKLQRASIKSLTEPLDTSSPMGTFMLQVLGAVAQLERSIIRERTMAGQVAAINRGQQFGRPKILSSEQEREVLALIDQKVAKAAVARQFGVSLIVVRRIVDERSGKKNTGQFPVLKKFLDD